jgi:dihydrofolate synthase/folylpolyglutamate synthase
MTYKETLKYLFEQLPMYQRTGKAAYKGDLVNTLELDGYFGHPHRKYKTIHVAGTNGKGSVSHMLASVLQCAGYKTGLYTSPHLLDFRERVRVNGEMISELEIVDFVAQNKQMLEKISPSFFEMTVALAFDYFAREMVDVAVIEVGLGGRLDSTNIIRPELSVITNIGMDHTMFLGNTMDAIAGEKAGIIKSDVPVVVGRYQSETADVFRKKANAENAPLIFAFEVCEMRACEVKDNKQVMTVVLDEETETYKVPLMGAYQQENLMTTLTAVSQLKRRGLVISKEASVTGIEKVIELTGLMGRWQQISAHPVTICDTAHNADGINRVMTQIEESEFDCVHIVWGMVNDKDIDEILKLLPGEARYYFTKANIPRALDENVLQQKALLAGCKGERFSNVRLAISAAQKNASGNDLIFIGGSTFVVAEALEK